MGIDLRKPIRKMSVESIRVNPVSAGVDSLTQGATLGWQDEYNAGVRAGVRWLTETAQGQDPDFTSLYQDRLAQERDTLAAQREAYPVLSGVSEVVGGLSSGGSAVAGAASRGHSVLNAWLRGIAAGSGAGALAGAGSGEGIEGRAAGSVEGAGIGAVLPGLGVPAAKVVGATARPLINMLNIPGTINHGKQAARKVLRALARDKKTVEGIGKRLGRAPDKPLTVVDVAGTSTRDLADAAALTPGPGSSRTENILQRRQQFQRSRIDRDLETISPSKDFYADFDKLMADRRTAANRLYENVADMDAPVQNGKNYQFNDLKELIESRPIMGDVIKDAQDYLKKFENKDFPMVLNFTDDGRVVVGNAITTRAVNQMKRALDRMWKNASRNDPGRASAILDQKKDLLRIIDDLNPEYKAARTRYASDSEALEAMKAGRKFMQGSANQKVHEFGKMSADERVFFRKGITEGIQDILDRSPDGADAVKRIFASAGNRKRFAAAFDSVEDYRDFTRNMINEARMSRTRNDIRGNSKTVRRTVALEDVRGAAPNVLDSLVAPVTSTLKRVGQRLDGFNARSGEEINKLLMSSDVNDLAALSRRQGADELAAENARKFLMGLSGGTGTVAGLLSGRRSDEP